MSWAEWLSETWRQHGTWGRVEVVVILTACGVGFACLAVALVLLWRLLYSA